MVVFPANRSTERCAIGPRSKGLISCKPRNKRIEISSSLSGYLSLFSRGVAEQITVEARIAEKSRTEGDMAMQ
jgi:hypothetical protein